jgi:membrane associated rhomboid family serine protease
MIPLSDNNPTRKKSWLTWAIIALCGLVFVGQFGGSIEPDVAVQMYGFIPAFTLGGMLDPAGLNMGWSGIFSSMFMHGDIAHLGGNMLYLYVFGDNLENALGRIKFGCFYCLGGVAAALAQGVLEPSSVVPMIGASGAISAVLGGYAVLYPRQPITVAMPYVGITHLPALVVLGLWFGYQLLYGLAAESGGGGVAFWAHIGGFVAGVATIKIFQPRVRPQLWR